MKNSFKLLVLWLLTPLLFFWLSFWFNPFDSFVSVSSFQSNDDNFEFSFSSWFVYCYYNSSIRPVGVDILYPSCRVDINICSDEYVYLSSNSSLCFNVNQDYSLVLWDSENSSNNLIYIYRFDSPFSDCSNDSNYLTCLDRVNQLNWQVWTLSWNLSTCQSNYNSCLSDSSHCDTLVGVCQENLSWCQESNSSLQNYNDSLNSQLQEFLENWTWWSWWNYIALYDIFRSSDWNDYSLPITNNIHLPLWYRGFLDEGVLAIKRINTLDSAYSISDEDYKDKIIWSYSTIFLFFVSSGLFLVFLFAIRRYFIWLRSFR